MRIMADMLGYAASFAVLATFLMRTMVPLRLVAIFSNILFLAFAYVQNIHPILFLHMALLPINAWRLLASRKSADAQLTAPLLAQKRLPNI
jgi:CRP/FNR family transcriptional regulator, cyclic AMP receptor protein